MNIDLRYGGVSGQMAFNREYKAFLTSKGIHQVCRRDRLTRMAYNALQRIPNPMNYAHDRALLRVKVYRRGLTKKKLVFKSELIPSDQATGFAHELQSKFSLRRHVYQFVTVSGEVI